MRRDPASDESDTASIGNVVSRVMERSVLSKYIYAVLGVGMAGALILSYNSSAKSAVLVTSATLVGLAIILLFERAARSSSRAIAAAGIVLLFSASFFFISFLAFTISVFAFSWPPAWGVFLGVHDATVSKAPVKLMTAELTQEEVDGHLKIKKWFCSNLNEKFQVSVLVSSFPLESMPAVVESQKENWFHFLSTGSDYSIEFRYAVDDDGENYGHTIYLQETSQAYPPLFDTRDKKIGFIKLFGEPEELDMGQGLQVGIKKMEPFEKTYAFYFSFWEHGQIVTAEWFYPRDIRLADRLCPAEAA